MCYGEYQPFFRRFAAYMHISACKFAKNLPPRNLLTIKIAYAKIKRVSEDINEEKI